MRRTYLVAVQDQPRIKAQMEALGYRVWVGFNCITIDWNRQ